MANEPRVRERPLSPHLQVYRWQVQMVTSILHRATGIVLVVGSLIVAWGLLALAAGPETWSTFTAFNRSAIGFLILFGWSWSLAYHLLNGIRHLLWDAGWGFDIPDVYRSGWAVAVLTFVFTAAIWLAAWPGGVA